MLDRRTLLAFFAATGAANSLLPGTLWAQIQPGTRKLTIEMVREAAALAGLSWTDQECQELLDALSSFSRHAEGIDKATLTQPCRRQFSASTRCHVSAVLRIWRRSPSGR